MKTVDRFWPFMKADYRAAETYLETQSRKGLHITRIDSKAVWATYEKGEPRNIKYSIDYHNGETEERDAYKALLADAGWQHVADMDLYMIFASKENAAPIPIHTDWEEECRSMRKGLWRYEIPLGIIAVVAASFLYRENVEIKTIDQWVALFGLIGMIGFGVTGLLHSVIIYGKTSWAFHRKTPMMPPSYISAKFLGMAHTAFAACVIVGWLLRVGLIVEDSIAEGNIWAIRFFCIWLLAVIAAFVTGRLMEHLLPKKIGLGITLFLLALAIVGLIGLMFTV